MNYLDWKKHIIIYMVSRAKEIYAAPEELDFYIYSRLKKVVNAKSLPTALTLVLPVGMSVEKAVDCVALAVKNSTNAIYLDEVKSVSVRSINLPVDSVIITPQDITKIINSISAPSGAFKLWQKGDFSALARDAPLTLLKFNDISASLELVAVACVTNCNPAKSDIALMYTAAVAVRESKPLPTLAYDVDAGAKFRIGLTPDLNYPTELVLNVDAELLGEIDAAVKDIESENQNQNIEIGLADSTLAVSAGTIKMAPLTQNVGAIFNSKITVKCLAKSYIADYTGVYISSLAGQPISSLVNKIIS